MHTSSALIIAAAAVFFINGGTASADAVKCRQLAGSIDEPNNAERIGSELSAISSVEAVIACGAAFNGKTISSYRYARALQATGPLQDIPRAFGLYSATWGLAKRPDFIAQVGSETAEWYLAEAQQAVNIAAYLEAAEKGDAFAQTNLAVLYGNKRFGFLDREKRDFWIQKAAEQGYASAQLYLGKLKEDSSTAEAIDLYRRAASKNLALAQIQLGFIHRVGKGVGISEKEANVLFHLAAAQGSREAQQYIKREPSGRDLTTGEILALLAVFGVVVIIAGDGSVESVSTESGGVSGTPPRPCPLGSIHTFPPGIYCVYPSGEMVPTL